MNRLEPVLLAAGIMNRLEPVLLAAGQPHVAASSARVGDAVSFYLPPDIMFWLSMLAAAVIVGIIWIIANDVHATTHPPRCICGHEKKQHAGFLAFECLKCKCRRYIEEWRK